MNTKIDPWGAVHVKDYKKLCEEFGIEDFSKLIDNIPNPSLSMRRGLVLGHKDFQIILKSIKEKKNFVMMTGLMPSGTFHFGHKSVVDQMVYYQEHGAECFITAADIESYLTRDISFEDARKIAIEEYLLNYIALGLKPKNVHFYFQSQGSKSYNNLSKMISKRTTFNEIKSIYGDTNPAKLVSALTQVADILHPQLKEFGGPRPIIVPVGFDQVPHANFSRDIASRMKDFKFIMPSFTFNTLMPGLKGGKMSSSDPTSYISFSDSPKEVENKVKKYAFSGGRETLEEHRKKGGNPDIDISYQWLKLIFEEEDKKLKEIHDNYKSGSLLTGELKAILIEKINAFLKQHNEKRERAKKIVDKFLN